jgi:hypothetical protein
MRFNSKLLPENIRRCMPKEERKELKILTDDEAQARVNRGEELKLHAQFESWCRRNGVVYVHSRTDRKSTIAKGHPDFTLLWGGKGCLVEFKAENGSLSPEQIEKLPEIGRANVPVLVTSSYQAAVSFAMVNLGISDVL